MYNPFNKDISEIEYGDLEKLIENNVSEGWFIEYKGSFPNNKKIANSIASFANSEGGWYIVGIEENENESGPSEIIGINLDEFKKPADKITNIIKDNIDPIPYFESKIVEISENKVVLIVHVFEGNDAPYICDGRVYIRVGETSKLLAIKDRYQFEMLLNRKHEHIKKINAFMKNNFFIEKSFKQPYLEFYLYLDSPYEFLFEDFYEKEFFDEIKNIFNGEVTLVEFDELYESKLNVGIHFLNIYSTLDSIILRHVGNNSLFQTGLTIEIFRQGHFKVIFPFNIYNVLSLNEDYDYLDEYVTLIPDSDEMEFLKIIDLANAMISFQIIIEQYLTLLKRYNLNNSCFVKFSDLSTIIFSLHT